MINWTPRAQDDLAAIHAFIAADSPASASAVVRRLLAAARRLERYPNLGRVVPEFARENVRELIQAPYRIVYRAASEATIDILTVHHGARRFPARLK